MVMVRGAWMDQLSITQASALSAIEDTIAIVTALISGDEAGHSGAVFSVRARNPTAVQALSTPRSATDRVVESPTG